MTGFSHSHCGKLPLTTNYLTTMTLLQNITGGNRPAPFAVVLRPALSRDSSQSDIAPGTLDRWSDSYLGATTGPKQDTG
ncbi:hypothetical protein Har1130_10675 [Haloarcula sp. CBA1130]|nr:hypothetical protein Har1129_10770 [Haloarcula sp. CBA1129]KAA9403188.1 hypothetical protein Har1130_10675 [Haloarcula sp. CBA1130]